MRLREWTPVVLRAIIVVLVALPAAGKFLDYAGQVEFFRSLGIPASGLMVVVVGVVEVSSIVMLALGVAGRIARGCTARRFETLRVSPSPRSRCLSSWPSPLPPPAQHP